MKQLLRQLGISGALLVTVAGAPVIPEEMELLYSYHDNCEFTQPEGATTTIQDDRPYKPNCANGETQYAVSVFGDHKGNKVYVQIPLTLYEDMGKIDGILKSPKKNEYVSLFTALTAEGAIARNNNDTTFTTSTGLSVTYAYTVGSGSDRFLAVAAYDNSTNPSGQITGGTYNGVALSEYAEGPVGNEGSGRTSVAVLGLIAPASGSNNLVVTRSATGNNLFVYAADYTGADQTTQPDDANTNSCIGCSSLTPTLTSTVDDTWGFASVRNTAAAVTSGTNCTIFFSSSLTFCDSNGSLGTSGSETVTINTTGGGSTGIAAMLIKPASGGGGGTIESPPADIIWFD